MSRSLGGKVLHPETLPSFSAASGDDTLAPLALHPAQEAVLLVTLPVVRLKRTFHDRYPSVSVFSWNRPYANRYLI